MKDALREGYTTGTAAAAAARSAVAALLGSPPPTAVSVPLPPFTPSSHVPGSRGRLTVPVHQTGIVPPPSGQGLENGDGAASGITWASVVKDGGDDPDVTHGLVLRVTASLCPFRLKDPIQAPSSLPDQRGPEATSGPVLVENFTNPVYIYAGDGVGRATLPGLPVQPGEPAINPEPRLQIAAAACEAASEASFPGSLHLLVSAPGGEERARQTLNPRLGIQGGISILGTRGTVRPYSHEAWKTALEQGIRVASASGQAILPLSTGRRSEKALQGIYGPVAPYPVQAADFAGHALRLAVHFPFDAVAWGCFPGKLLKLAQGLEWTHAHSAAVDLTLLERGWIKVGGTPALLDSLRDLPTAAGALSLMRQASERDYLLTVRDIACLARTNMLAWMDDEYRRSGLCHPRPELFLHVFSLEGHLLISLGPGAVPH